MPTRVALGTHFEAFVKMQVASGRYNNASEVVRDCGALCSLPIGFIMIRSVR